MTISTATTTPASPAVTRSLDLEFEAEIPPGFQEIPAITYGSVSEHSLSYTAWQQRQAVSTAVTSATSAPVSSTPVQTTRHSTRPVITSVAQGNATQQTSTAQYYQPSLTDSMPPLYSPALRALFVYNPCEHSLSTEEKVYCRQWNCHTMYDISVRQRSISN
ncbi:hypothetical protein HanIR_Chr05g0211711 [Helianthus annuus]|nr:hypothetical protein HanIR_Chr05g0211711 [Helianthus annuus]